MKLKQAIKISAFSPVTKKWSQRTHIRTGTEVKCVEVRKIAGDFVAELRTTKPPIKVAIVLIEDLPILVT